MSLAQHFSTPERQSTFTVCPPVTIITATTIAIAADIYPAFALERRVRYRPQQLPERAGRRTLQNLEFTFFPSNFKRQHYLLVMFLVRTCFETVTANNN